MDDDEKLKDYQLAIENTFDFGKILKAIKENVNLIDPDIFKQYKHSLFSPILSFLIQYINDNGEKKGYIGKARIKQNKVLYAVLNREIYDIFFNRTKGMIGGDKSAEIDFRGSFEEENYFISSKIGENILNVDALKIIAANLIDEEAPFLQGKDLNTVEKIYEFKKRELISTFRMGYSTQERIASMLLENTENKLKELPNVLFYKENPKRKMYLEIDRILLSEKEITYPNIKIYYKVKYDSGNITFEVNEKGENLKFEENSINFIEIKNSIKSLLKDKEKLKEKMEGKKEKEKDGKKEKEKDGKKEKEKAEKKEVIISNKTPSNISSATSKSEKSNKKPQPKHLTGIMDFLKLYESFNIKNKKINIIYIIDGFFPKDFFVNVEDFANFYMSNISNLKEKIDFDLRFVLIESDAIFVHESNVIKEIKTNLKNFQDESNKKYNTLLQEYQNSKANYEQLQRESNEKYAALKTESEQKYDNYKLESEQKYDNLKLESERKYNTLHRNYNELNEKYENGSKLIGNLQEQLNEMKNKETLRKLKKNIKKKIIKNSVLLNYLQNMIVSENKEKNIIIGNYNHEKFITFEKFPLSNNTYEIIVDLSTFLRTDNSQKEEKIIEIIKNKHENNLDKYTHVKFQKLLILSDTIFYNNFVSRFEAQFKGKIVLSKYLLDSDLFLLSLEFNKDKITIPESQITIPGIIGYVNMDKCTNLLNFNNYLKEIKQINVSQNFVDLHIYNPYQDKDEFFISFFHNNDVQNEKLLIVTYNDLAAIPDNNLNNYKKENQYLLLIFDRKESSEKIINSIADYFFKNVETKIERTLKLLYKIVIEQGDNQILKSDNNIIIYNKRFNHGHYLYRLKKEKEIDRTVILDENIKALLKYLKIQGNIKTILIEEPLSIISLYLKNIFPDSKLVMLQSYFEKSIRKKFREGIQINFELNTKKNVIKYLQDGDNKYDAIILENNTFPDEKNDIIPNREYLKQENLSLFVAHLNNDGRIYFHVLIKNKYLLNVIKEEIEKSLSIINIIKLFPLEYLIICSHKI